MITDEELRAMAPEPRPLTDVDLLRRVRAALDDEGVADQVRVVRAVENPLRGTYVVGVRYPDGKVRSRSLESDEGPAVSEFARRVVEELDDYGRRRPGFD